MVTETRPAEPSGRNVLDELDSRIPTGFYWYLAVLACIGGFLSATTRPISARPCRSFPTTCRVSRRVTWWPAPPWARRLARWWPGR